MSLVARIRSQPSSLHRDAQTSEPEPGYISQCLSSPAATPCTQLKRLPDAHQTTPIAHLANVLAHLR